MNNLRDLDSDRKIGKKTLTVRRGRAFSCAEYAVLLLLPFVLLPRALALARLVRREPAGPGLNRILSATARLGVGFAVLLSVGAGLERGAS